MPNAADTLTAISMRLTRFSETSLIVTWFSSSQGKLKTVVRGAHRPKSSFFGKIDLFVEGVLTVGRSQRSELHTLREIALNNQHPGIRRHYVRTLAASYFSELVEETTEPDQSEPGIYRLLQRAYRYLDTHDPQWSSIIFFEAELAKLLGLEAEDRLRTADQLIASLSRVPTSRAQLSRSLTS